MRNNVDVIMTPVRYANPSVIIIIILLEGFEELAAELARPDDSYKNVNVLNVRLIGW